MAVINVAEDQIVRIPDLLMSDGQMFIGRVEAGKGEGLILAYNPEVSVELSGRDMERLYTLTWEVAGGQRTAPVLVRQVMEGRLVCQPVIEEKRQSLRMKCDMEVWATPIEIEQLQAEAERVLSRLTATTEPESVVDTMMRAESQEEILRTELGHIRGLLEKMVIQLEHLTQAVEGRSSGGAGGEFQFSEIVDCSATGLAILHQTPVEVGSFLKLKMVFRTLTRMTIHGVGVIMRCEPLEGTDEAAPMFNIGVRFTHIHEADRERIFRHIFKLQRSQLRDRRLGAGAVG